MIARRGPHARYTTNSAKSARTALVLTCVSWLKDLTFLRADRGQKKCGGQAEAPFDALKFELLFAKIGRKMSLGSQNYRIFCLFYALFSSFTLYS